jgi:hypothetical protein
VAYTLFTLAERPDLEPQIDRLSVDAWPLFLRHSNNRHWHSLFEIFAPYQLLLCNPDNSLIAVGHTVPLVWDGSAADLPSTIDEIIIRAERGHATSQAPNTFSALAAMVAPKRRGQRLSRDILLEMKALARRNGCDALIAPVRPTLKSHYPLTPMERYVAWTLPGGEPFDPWLRVHWRLGARSLRIAPNTMTVEGTIQDWEQWTGMAFPESGAYVVPGALQPVVMDCERDWGRYEEPNFWMRHPAEELPGD